ncbi:MAG: hypothetical protein QF681_00420 [Vicinamibacterales bacterium]|nr:hypothetical protein [Vicinamibacterales bacterium]
MPTATRGAPDSAAPHLTPGQRFGRYRIERLLGRGGMGEVYEAEDLESGRRLALKILLRSLADEADRDRFLREGRLAAAVSHPNTVYVYGTEEIERVPPPPWFVAPRRCHTGIAPCIWGRPRFCPFWPPAAFWRRRSCCPGSRLHCWTRRWTSS